MKLEGKFHVGIHQMLSQLDIVCRNCLGRNGLNHDQSLRKHSDKKLNIKIETATKSHECFIICQYKTE